MEGTGWVSSVWWGEIGKGAIALVAGYIGAIALERYKKRKSKPSVSADYLDAVASALEAVANKLQIGDDASLETHMLFHLIRGFRSGFRHIVDDEMMARLDKLAATYYRPSTGAPYGPHPKLKEGKDWIIKARKTAGNLRAKAQLLKTK